MRIALMGYARSGKDTVHKLIQGYNMKPVYKIAFGDELKFHFHHIFNIPAEPKPRKGYEDFGKYMRSIDQDVWVNQLERTFKLLSLEVTEFVITDLRQPNEAKWARENGFTIVKVSSPVMDRVKRSQDDSEFNAVNESEKLIEKIEYDFQLFNDGSIESLREQVEDLLHDIKGS